MPDTDIVKPRWEHHKITCSDCGAVFDSRDAGMGYNVGFGPQYFCLECTPPATAEEVIAAMEWAMEFTEEKV